MKKEIKINMAVNFLLLIFQEMTWECEKVLDVKKIFIVQG